MNDEQWAAWEASYETEQAHLNRVRVRGYTLACAERVQRAQAELEQSVTVMLQSRAGAERALATLYREIDHAEEMAGAVMLDDPELNEQLALALERLEEVA